MIYWKEETNNKIEQAWNAELIIGSNRIPKTRRKLFNNNQVVNYNKPENVERIIENKQDS